MRPHRGALILVYGILGFVLCPFFGIAAWSMGTTDLEEMNQGRMDSSGRDLTKAGRLCGMISTVILIFQVIVMIVVGITMAIARN